MKIRREVSEDIADVRALLTDAFGRTAEADLADALRPEAALSLVAEADGEVTGHLMLSPLDAPFRACALAPVAVAPLWQGRGIGTALIRAAMDMADCDAIFVLGDPEFYGQLGFRADLAAGYACAYAGPHLMIHARHEVPATGRILYPQAFSAAGSSDPR
ncbi:GNAT family N-acetyltransferase [Falsirhodobacter algicola]|uniref:GNAT family N-acetyltransferase n=1 Tax=Falsirhodobacter algicola TaxID=2692330 RepID=A0A8J8MSF5_9RHOB|nr:N-acetyltransferase [Falsirhodobacter algicola]QUS35617.1 GNAT family N-acetyltransferase [Falsirhodobacter algicola]